MIKPRSLIAGNWKMNGLRAQISEMRAVEESLRKEGASCDVAICPPATLAGLAAGVMEGGPVALGGQDCHAMVSGAFTGDVSAQMWKDLGARYVIVGHSERRDAHNEGDKDVAAKAEAVIAQGLVPIICIGESLAQRKGGETLSVLGAQIRGSIPEGVADAPIVIAYEPIWAIGTGLTPTIEEITEAHDFLRAAVSEKIGASGAATPILYGGSVKPSNAAEILAVTNVNGALVGGASLKAADFLGIIRAA